MVSGTKLAIIPARGGSKRVPRKNIVPFMGKPLMAWTIEAAIDSKCFDRIIVSTDDEEIAKIALEYGAEIPFLREGNSDDNTPVSYAITEMLSKLQQNENANYDMVVQLMANCPLRNSQDIVNSLNNFINKQHGSQISCFKYGWMNPWWAVELDSNDKPNPVFFDGYGKRSQDLPPLYCPTGAIWVSYVNKFLESGSFYTGDHAFFPIDWISALDIDNYDDLEMAELLFNMRNKKQYQR